MTQILINCIKGLIGLLILIILVWNRVRSRDPLMFKDISDSSWILIISSCDIILFLLLVIKESLRIWGYKETEFMTKVLSWPPVDKVLSFVIKYILSAPEYLYDVITERFRLRWLIEQPASYFSAYFEEYPRVFVILFYFIPCIIVATVFLFEALLLNQRVYFFLILDLLI